MFYLILVWWVVLLIRFCFSCFSKLNAGVSLLWLVLLVVFFVLFVDCLKLGFVSLLWYWVININLRFLQLFNRCHSWSNWLFIWFLAFMLKLPIVLTSLVFIVRIFAERTKSHRQWLRAFTILDGLNQVLSVLCFECLAPFLRHNKCLISRLIEWIGVCFNLWSWFCATAQPTKCFCIRRLHLRSVTEVLMIFMTMTCAIIQFLCRRSRNYYVSTRCVLWAWPQLLLLKFLLHLVLLICL